MTVKAAVVMAQTIAETTPKALLRGTAVAPEEGGGISPVFVCCVRFWVVVVVGVGRV